MTIPQAASIGKTADEISQAITGRSDVCVERSVVSTATGGALGAAAAAGVVVTGVVAAPVTVPLAAAAAIGGFIFSLFD